MIRSMTGFGRYEYSDEKRNITVEIKSVNHRYCDITVRMPRKYSFAEDAIKNAIKNEIRRGKVEASIFVENVDDSEVSINLNEALARQYFNALTRLKDILGMEENVSLEYISSLPDILKAVPTVEDEEKLTAIFVSAASKAAQKHTQMRIAEGEKLASDILLRADIIENHVKEIEKRAPGIVSEHTKKLKARIEELIGGSIPIAEERILVEAAVFADKVNVTEETVRLKSHISQLRAIISDNTRSEGKKLDFLVQEMNREANTIGSKSNDIETTGHMLEIKSEIEKIREQVQNIE